MLFVTNHNSRPVCVRFKNQRSRRSKLSQNAAPDRRGVKANVWNLNKVVEENGEKKLPKTLNLSNKIWRSNISHCTCYLFCIFNVPCSFVESFIFFHGLFCPMLFLCVIFFLSVCHFYSFVVMFFSCVMLFLCIMFSCVMFFWYVMQVNNILAGSIINLHCVFTWFSPSFLT